MPTATERRHVGVGANKWGQAPFRASSDDTTTCGEHKTEMLLAAAKWGQAPSLLDLGTEGMRNAR